MAQLRRDRSKTRTPPAVRRRLCRYPPRRHTFQQQARLAQALAASHPPQDAVDWFDRFAAARVWLEFSDRAACGTAH